MENGSNLQFNKPKSAEKTIRVQKDYHLAYADTLSSPAIPFIQSLARQNRNSSLVMQISHNIGDTSETPVKSGQSMIEDKPVPMNTEKSPVYEIQTNESTALTDVLVTDAKEETLPIDLAVIEAVPDPSCHIDPVQKPSRKAPRQAIQPHDSIPTPTPLDIKLYAESLPTQSTQVLLREQHDTVASSVPQKHEQICVNFHDQSIEQSDTVVDPGKTPSKEINIGSVVAGRYEILSKISEGGFGVVYRARQLGIDRVVALKRLRTQRDETVNQRFLLEANIIKDLIHPNTIQLIDAGMDGNHLYIVMEYIEGISLKTLIREEKILPPLRAIHIASQILKSLHEAHERGIVHRDIKPSNILIRDIIGERDFVKLLDFGIAKARFKNDARITQDGKILGTPQYLAPELLFGDEATPASDTFAVGLLLVEMLTGRSPLPKDVKKLLKLVTTQKTIHIPESLANSELGPIIQCALNISPRHRYRTAAEMLDDLKRVEMKLNMSNSMMKSPLTAMTKAPKERFNIYKIALAAMLFILANVVILFYILK